MKQIALIGLGGISQSVHLPLLMRNDARFKVAALVDLSAERAKRVAGRIGGENLPQFTDIEQLLAAHSQGLAIDGAILATTGSHARDAGKLIRAGIKVLAEKPLAFTLTEHEELIALAAELGLDLADWLRVGYMKEHDPALQAAHEILKDKQIRSVQVEVLHPADGAQLAFAQLLTPPSDVDEQAVAPLVAATQQLVDQAIGNPGEVLQKLYTNVVLGSVIHDISALRRMVGGIGSVDRAKHWGDSFPGSLELGGQLKNHDAPWSINWHFIADYPQYEETITVHHEQGSIEVLFSVPYILNAPTILTITESTGEHGVAKTRQTWPQQEAFEKQLWTFHELLGGSLPQGPSVLESVLDIGVAQQIISQLSVSKGVKLEPVSEAGSNT